jgi:hypothetical protein
MGEREEREARGGEERAGEERGGEERGTEFLRDLSLSLILSRVKPALLLHSITGLYIPYSYIDYFKFKWIIAEWTGTKKL